MRAAQDLLRGERLAEPEPAHARPRDRPSALDGVRARRPDVALPSPQTVPPTPFLNTTATRVRMISYYIDNTDTAHPRLVRRINNGSPTSFDNTSGTTVAFDIDNLQISYDIADGVTNPANVRFMAADFAGTRRVRAGRPVRSTRSAR